MKGITTLLVIACAAVGWAQVEECPKEQEEDWGIELLLRHEDCEKFYKCTLGKPVEMSCPSKLWFNLETWRCDWPENVDCEDRNIPTTTTSTTSTTTREPITAAPTEEPTTIPETTTTTTTTTTTPAPTTTTTTTTTPAPTTTTTTTTTPAPTTTTTTTTTPAPTTTTTTTTTPVPTTTTTTTTTPAPTTTTTTPVPTTPSTTSTTTQVPTEFLPNGCPVDPHIHWLLPHPTDCNAFYYCVWGDLVLRNCPENLHFNTTVQVCDWPWSAGCTVSLNKHLRSRVSLR